MHGCFRGNTFEIDGKAETTAERKGNVVTVDGVEIANVVEFDTERGYVVHFRPHPKTGQPYIDPVTLDRIVHETLHGIVRYEPKRV